MVLSPWSAKGLRGKARAGVGGLGDIAEEGSPSQTDDSDTPRRLLGGQNWDCELGTDVPAKPHLVVLPNGVNESSLMGTSPPSAPGGNVYLGAARCVSGPPQWEFTSGEVLRGRRKSVKGKGRGGTREKTG